MASFCASLSELDLFSIQPITYTEPRTGIEKTGRGNVAKLPTPPNPATTKNPVMGLQSGTRHLRYADLAGRSDRSMPIEFRHGCAADCPSTLSIPKYLAGLFHAL